MKFIIGCLVGIACVISYAVASFIPPKINAYRTGDSSSKSFNIKKYDYSYPQDEESIKYDYTLGFIEFNDDGFFAAPEQFDILIADIKSKLKDRDMLILLYVHGWNHNARDTDENVACFGEVLKAAAIMQAAYKDIKGVKPRAVYGIYVGWPGKVYEWDLANKIFSYFGREASADRVGQRGDLLRLFSTISDVRATYGKGAKFIIVSHSMGARATYKALRPIMLNAAYAKQSDQVAFIADASVMVNPAISADEHKNLDVAIRSGKFSTRDAAPRFVIMTSETDEVLTGVYTWPNLLANFVRGNYLLSSGPENTAMGLYDKYVTHELQSTEEPGSTLETEGCPTLRHDELEIVRGSKRVKNKAELYDFREIKRHISDGRNPEDSVVRASLKKTGTMPDGPIAVIRVSRNIIPDHNDIFTNLSVEFIARVVNANLYLNK